jgi:predicted transposase/invertase (TIGR01784 family)
MHVLRLGNLPFDNQFILDGAALDEMCLPLQRWVQLWVLGSKLEENEMTAILQDMPEVKAAYDEYKRFTSDPVLRQKAMARERYLTDQYLDRADALAEGRAEGRAEGEAVGVVRGKIETARNMKRKGYAVADIVDITGLSVSEVEGL